MRDVKLFLCGKEIKDIDFSKCAERCNECPSAVKKENKLTVYDVEKELLKYYGGA